MARGEAAREVENAKAYTARVVAEATGESERFIALLREYERAPEVTRQRLYLETVENVMSHSSKVLLDVEGGSNLTYLPLDQIIQRQAPLRQSPPSTGMTDSSQQATQPESTLTREVDRSRRGR